MLHDPEVTVCRDLLQYVLNRNVTRSQAGQAIINVHRQVVGAFACFRKKWGETAKDQQSRPQGEHIVQAIPLLRHSLRLR